VSSAILYLAIIAIWACVLVPRWIHKPHRMAAARSESASVSVSQPGPQAQEFSGAPVSVPLGAHEATFGSGPGAGGSWTSTGWTEPAEGTVPPLAGESEGGSEADGEWPGRGAAFSADGAEGGEQGHVVEHRVAWQRLTVRSGYHAADGADGAEVGAEAGAGGQAGSAHPGSSRAHIMQSRRRLLTMLVTLMIASLTCTVTGLSPWWVLAPTGGMLGMYLLLLRESANADAELAQWQAQEHAAYREAARLRAREAWEAAQAEQTAEIIDISDRVGDQLYDQYADAAVRAVGD
jgi:hypothetical protein